MAAKSEKHIRFNEKILIIIVNEDGSSTTVEKPLDKKEDKIKYDLTEDELAEQSFLTRETTEKSLTLCVQHSYHLHQNTQSCSLVSSKQLTQKCVVDSKTSHLHTEDKSILQTNPFIPVKFSEEEEKIRKQLVGVIPARKRVKHDYAKMYGCGTTCFENDSDSDDEHDDDLDKPPTRILTALPSSECWFKF